MLALALLQLVALKGGTVHTMLPGEVPRVATVLVRDGLIDAIGADLAVPPGALVLDARGQHLVPGLIDGMVHHDLEHDPLYVLAGVTCVRDMGNDLGRIFDARARAVRDAGPGPELVVCGAVLDGSPPATTEAVVVTSAAEVDDKLPRLAALGCDFVATHLGLPPAAWDRTIELSHQIGLSVWGPVPRGLTLLDLVAKGQDGLLYLEGFLPAGATWESIESADLAPARELVARSRLALTPLLRVYARRIEVPGPDDDLSLLDLLAPHYAGYWMQDLHQRRELLSEEARAAGRRTTALQLELVRALWEAGVALVPGSAAPNPWLPPGAGLHDELALLVEAGIPPADVLAMTTRGAAEQLGLGQVRGTLAAGRVADIVCVGSDPCADLAVLRRPARVVLRGVVLEREDLARMRRDVIARQDEARRRASLPIEVPEVELCEGAVPLLGGRAESVAFGQILSAERWIVADVGARGRVYCARIASADGMQTTLTQRVADGLLQDFELLLTRASRQFSVRGLRTGGQFRIERRVQGMHLDTTATHERLVLVDVGSVTTALVLAQQQAAGHFAALYLEDVEPAVGRWELALGADGARLVRMGSSEMVATFRPDGGIEQIVRREGAGLVRTAGVASETYGGPGLPLAPEKPAGGR